MDIKTFNFFRLRALVILHQSYSLKKVKNSKNAPSKKWWKFYKKEKKDEKKRKIFEYTKNTHFLFIYQCFDKNLHPTKSCRAVFSFLGYFYIFLSSTLFYVTFLSILLLNSFIFEKIMI